MDLHKPSEVVGEFAGRMESPVGLLAPYADKLFPEALEVVNRFLSHLFSPSLVYADPSALSLSNRGRYSLLTLRPRADEPLNDPLAAAA